MNKLLGRGNNSYMKNGNVLQGAYKFGKMKFLSFPKPLKQSFPYSYNVKIRCNKPPYQPFRYLSCSNAELHF